MHILMSSQAPVCIHAGKLILPKKYNFPLQTTGDVVSYLKFGINVYLIKRRYVEFKEEIYLLKELYQENEVSFDELNDEVQKLIDEPRYSIYHKASLVEFEDFLKSRHSQ